MNKVRIIKYLNQPLLFQVAKEHQKSDHYFSSAGLINGSNATFSHHMSPSTQDLGGKFQRRLQNNFLWILTKLLLLLLVNRLLCRTELSHTKESLGLSSLLRCRSEFQP